MTMHHRFITSAVIALVIAAATTTNLGAQDVRDPHDAQPERPTVATHAGTVAPGWFEVETGIERDRIGPDNTSFATPTLLKFGIARRVQFDVNLTTLRPASGVSSGFGDGGIGIKWRLADSAPLVGAFALQPSVKFPTGSMARGTGTGTTDFSILAISSHVIGPTALDVNLGYTRRGNGTAGALWTVSTGTTLVGPLAWAAEVYGMPGLSQSVPSAGFLTGPTYTVEPSFVLDAGLILDLAGSQRPALYAGLTWNVGRFP